VFESVCGVTGRRLKLKVNREKSSIRHAAQATLLGFGFFFDGPRVGIRIAPQAIQRLKDQLRMLTRRRWSVSMEYRIGRLNRLITGAGRHDFGRVTDAGRVRMAGRAGHHGIDTASTLTSLTSLPSAMARATPTAVMMPVG
jgi:hypothetical protein